MAPAPKQDSQLIPTAPSPDDKRVRLCARTAGDEPFTDPITVQELRDTCQGMLDAVDEECEAVGAETVRLESGERRQVVASGSIYVFEAAEPVDASAGDPVLLQLGMREVEGAVVSCKDRVIELTLNDDLGAAIPPGGKLLLGAPWMLLRLRQRVRDAFEIGYGTPRLFHLANALRTLGIGEIEVRAAELVALYENETRPLNKAQERAVDVAFRSPLTVIAAPAGTGKTLTLGALVEAAYRAGLRVLVAAPSNVAVDLQMLQVCARLEGEEGFKSAEVLRVGADAGQALRERFGTEVVLDEVFARLRPKAQRRLERAQLLVDEIAADLTAAQRRAGTDAAPDVARLRLKLADARSGLRRLRQDVRDDMRALIADARVVGATLTRAYIDKHIGMFDLVVIDEASMAHGPAVFIAAGLARRHLVLAGDPYQLAAPVRSTGPNRHWLAVDVFQRLDVISAIRHEENVPYLTQLDEQRRSANDICELQRALWYGPGLRTAREVFVRERQRKNTIFGTASLCYLDTSSLGSRAHHPWGRTYANDQHARLIADLIAYLDSAGEIPAPGGDESAVTVLSHYRGQVAAVRRILGRRYAGRGVDVRTVHRAQGAECITGVFDLTLASNVPTRYSSVLTAVRPEDDGSRLLAVAASRARSRFVFVGDMEWIGRAVARHTVLGRMWAHLGEHGYAIPIGEIQGSVPLPSLRVLR